MPTLADLTDPVRDAPATAPLSGIRGTRGHRPVGRGRPARRRPHPRGARGRGRPWRGGIGGREVGPAGA
ncbi:hypothetical protein TPA0910_83430 [Streptomyces hygroscopicus subsp. sporocinereus]|uniref:Uncharacterized protein n=1 Tax=Streptomyces hygroscopicus TaxID=1912 RepID=A0ABQ3UE86_STRHY|nr:hypothetical protein TPA0910_83430 [Streptomyces hygroscopicus]